MGLLLRFAYNVLRLMTWPAWGLSRWLRRRRHSRWLTLRIRGSVHELPHGRRPLRERLLSSLKAPGVTVYEVRRLRELLQAAPEVEGLLVSLDSIHGSWATLHALRLELLGIRETGKQVQILLPHGAGDRELLVASAGDTVITTPPAPLSALGAAVTRPYVAALLGRLGLEVQVFAQGDYKTAAESLSRSEMSAREREQLSVLLDTLQCSWSRAVSRRKGVGEEGVHKLIEQGLLGPDRAKALGIVDDILYEDELETSLGYPPPRPMRSHRAYVRDRRPILVPVRPRRRIAIARLEGPIATHAAGRGISLASTRALLRALAQNPQVAGVILHIDSPGGSAVASDLLHREILRLAEAKPVVAWCGGVAASGGYYLAVAARSIVARPESILGSIGVISARLVATKALDLLSVRQEVVKTSSLGDLHTPRALSSAEAALVEAETQRFYERFVQVVARGRKRPPDEILPLAGGRVWSGEDAFRHGLVDTLGGYPEARAAIDAALGAEAARVDPEPMLVEPMGKGALADALGQATTWLGIAPDDLARLQDELALLSHGERVLAYARDLSAL